MPRLRGCPLLKFRVLWGFLHFQALLGYKFCLGLHQFGFLCEHEVHFVPEDGVTSVLTDKVFLVHVLETVGLNSFEVHSQIGGKAQEGDIIGLEGIC